MLFFASTLVEGDRDAYTLEHFQNVDYDGKYSYAWRTSNGINAEESGIGE